jgi:ATP-binding cassette, subfamily C, bacterial CydC
MTIRYLMSVLKPHYGRLAVYLGIGLLNQIFTIGAAGIGAWLVGAAITGSSLESLLVPFYLLLGVVTGRGIVAWLESWLSHDLAYKVLAELRMAVYWALERLAPGYLVWQRSGDLITAAMKDVETLEVFYAHSLGGLVIMVVVTGGSLVALALLHPLLPLVVLPWIGLVMTVPFWLRRRAARQGQTLQEQLGIVSANLVDGIQGLREIAAFGQEERQLAKLRERNRALRQAQTAYGLRAGLEASVSTALIALAGVSMLLAAAGLVGSGAMPARLYPVSVVLATAIFAPITAFTETIYSFGLVRAAAGCIFDILHEPPLVADKVATSPAHVEPYVRFENVSFRYNPELPLALNAVSFKVNPGETVALVGHSGAGKSTCIQLLLRFWDVEAGAIRLGKHDLRDFTLADLRDLMAVVPQDVYLFNVSLLDNIRLGKPDASQSEVEAAARAALAHDFISVLPHGYATKAGERGLQLSGGQRQRIAIARALLKNAPILVMDEAVSNLDTESEREVRQAIQNLQQGRTTLIVAHRLSTIRSADRIVVLQNGEVAESGTHSELLSRDGVYARLIASQQNGLVDVPARPDRVVS